MVCTSLGSLLRPLFHFLCLNLKANPVHVLDKTTRQRRKIIVRGRMLYVLQHVLHAGGAYLHVAHHAHHASTRACSVSQLSQLSKPLKV